MADRTPLIAGNWKMNKTVAEAEAYIQGLLPRISAATADVAICVPFTALQAMVDSTRGSGVTVYAQNMHEAQQGAYTGEVSAAMLNEFDVHGAILGHSATSPPSRRRRWRFFWLAARRRSLRRPRSDRRRSRTGAR